MICFYRIGYFSNHGNKLDCTTTEYVETDTVILVGSSIQYISITLLVSRAGLQRMSPK